MIAHKATFKKIDGSLRTMVFCRLSDIPDDFMVKNVGYGGSRTLAEDSELVWDLESDAFRVFNWATLIGDVKEFEIDEEVFNL